MSDSVQQRIQKLLQQYEAGRMTKTEVTIRITQYAYRPGFTQCLSLLPDNVIDRLRDIADKAPAHPEDVCIVGGGTLVINDIKAYYASKRKENERYYWGAKALREHFYPDRPLPEFQVLKEIGVVEKTLMTPEGVAVTGSEEFAMSYIHLNPLRCQPPSGERIDTTFEGTVLFDDNDSIVTDVRGLKIWHLNRGIILGPNVTSPDQIPSGTVLYVDRDKVRHIPKPEVC